MGRGRAASYDEQRELILAQAAQLFAQRGYPATSMNEVALACGLSKATLYHYYADKYALLLSITDTHVSRLEAIVAEVMGKRLRPQQRMGQLIRRVVDEYATAQHAHRVLTEDVKFLRPDDRQHVLDKERAVVAGFAAVIKALRPDLAQAAMSKPLTMLLFGMINWLFTWMRADAALSYAEMARVVEQLFLGGLASVQPTPTPTGAPKKTAPAH